jgi:Ca2+-binding EF-hand superfamily protein
MTDSGRTWRWSLGLLAALLLAPAGRPAQAPQRADPGSAEDVQDVLFFSDSRPVLIRLHILVDGKPYGGRWTEHLTRWFRFLDRDEDGFLSRAEAGRAPGAPMLQQLMNNPFNFQAGNAPPFDNLDRDQDGKVSLAEFLRHYRPSPAGPVQLVPVTNPSARQDLVTEALFTLLDADKDGRLSQTELAAAESVLHKYDQDDDELITAQELVPPGTVPAPNPVRLQRMPAQPPSLPLMLVPREDAPRRIATRLRVAKEVLARYDKNKNNTLSRDEIGMPNELFDQLDDNKDGELDSLELLRWVIITPDIEVVLRLGRVEGKREMIEAAGRRNPALRRTASNALAFSFEENCINLIPASSVPSQSAPSIRRFFVQQFKAADQKNKGYLTKKQLQMPQFFNLYSILTVADRDEDDSLGLDELNAWADLMAGGLNCQTTVSLAESGRGLFQILNANQDGRLSIRELRNVWTRLSPYDRGGDRSISRKDIPFQYQIAVNPGGLNFAAVQPGGNPQAGLAPAPLVSARGPLWFRKMDRNGDGDVSPREFLGTREDFRRLDTDGDGLISLEEAIRADAALRKK